MKKLYLIQALSLLMCFQFTLSQGIREQRYKHHTSEFFPPVISMDQNGFCKDASRVGDANNIVFRSIKSKKINNGLFLTMKELVLKSFRLTEKPVTV